MSDFETNNVNLGLFGRWKPSDYIEQRAKQYQAWYDRKAVTAKSSYLHMRTTVVLGGVIVPVIVNALHSD